MGDMHSFSVDVAKEVGVNAAILLQSIKWWCEKNRANGKHFHDGLYWTYNSVKAWKELYPYLGKSAIDSALKRLEERGLIVVGNHNKSAYDRTKWYAITEDGLRLFGDSISENREMEYTEIGNPNEENREPIPVTTQLPNTGISTDTVAKKTSQTSFEPPTIDEVRAYVTANGYHFDVQEFYDYYSSGNWCKGNGQKVRRWKQCCATWEGTWRKRYGQQDRRTQYTEQQNIEFDMYAWKADEIESV